MLNSATAEIIPFPARPAPVTLEPAGAAPVVTEEQTAANLRLARALQSLDTALTEQRVAIAAWREALGQLRATVSGLSTSVQTYHDTLDDLGTKVVTLNGEARRLESWADNAIAQCAAKEAPSAG
jgi:chromosome segregation ATPase